MKSRKVMKSMKFKNFLREFKGCDGQCFWVRFGGNKPFGWSRSKLKPYSILFYLFLFLFCWTRQHHEQK